MKTYSLRQATVEDVRFLFKVSTLAMQPVNQALNNGDKKDGEEEFKAYSEKFVPQKISIIQHDGHDVGRLRVVRDEELIYIGGIQLLPEYQHKGIGGAIVQDLIEESNKSSKPIMLEVHFVNTNAILFYTKMGFQKTKKTETQWEMEYVPNKN